MDETTVAVWRIALGRDAGAPEAMAEVLSDDERARADRLRVVEYRNRYVQTRGAVRAILGRCLGIGPEQVRIHYGTRGKPALAAGSSRIHFNVSHSGNVALCAVARGREVGVDVELVRAGRPLERLAKRFFAAGEIAALMSAAPEERTALFFRCWTRKESYIKARGEGLAIPLDQFEVATGSGERAALLRVDGAPGERDRWRIVDLDVGEGYAASLAVEGKGWRLARWEFKGNALTADDAEKE